MLQEDFPAWQSRSAPSLLGSGALCSLSCAGALLSVADTVNLVAAL